MRARRAGLLAPVVALAVLAAGCSSSKTSTKMVYSAPTDAGTKLGNENIARFQRLVDEGLNQGRLAVMDELLSPTVLDHQFYGPGYPPSRGGVKGLTAALRTAFPDLHAVASTLVASNDGTQTFAIIKTTGTNTGPYLGVAPTGRKISLDIEESAKWKDGKMIEHWGVADNIGLLTQMGFFPPDALPAYSPTLVNVEYRKQLESPPAPKPTAATTEPQRVAAVKKAIIEGVNKGEIYTDADLVSSDFTEHEFFGAGFPDGVERHKDAIAVFKTALPDLQEHIQQLGVIGDGTQIFAIMNATGTNTGAFLGIPPTGKPVDIDVFEYFRFDKNGKIVEHNGVGDILGMIGDLGFLPPGAIPVYTKDKVDQQFRAELDLN